MSQYGWVSCGKANFRLELFGEIIGLDDLENGQVQPQGLASVAGIRARHYASPGNESVAHEILQIDIEETFLDNALELKAISTEVDSQAGAGEEASSDARDLAAFFTIISIPEDGLILEGTESPDDQFLNLISIAGWKLVLRKDDTGEMKLGFYLIGDWNFDTHPDYFPGSPFGEVSFIGQFGVDSLEKPLPLQLQIPWPFAGDAHLTLGEPLNVGGLWKTPILADGISTIFDASGPA